jgi:sugar phosphate permease
MVSYLDRMAMAIAIPFIATEFSLSATSMGVVMSAFFFGYACSQIPGGILVDRYGARKVFLYTLAFWSIMTAVTGAMWNLVSMIWVRVFFGIGEGLQPPSTHKTIGYWFRTTERSFAVSTMMTANVAGAALAPLCLVPIVGALGWRWCFYLLIIPGFMLATWIWFVFVNTPAEKKDLPEAELAETRTEGVIATSAESAASFWRILAEPVVWKSFVVILFYNMTLWGFTFWLPSYLLKARNLSMAQMGLASALPFIAGAVGLLLSGWISDRMFVNNRKIPVIINAWCGALCLYFMYTVQSLDGLVAAQTAAGFFIWGGAGVAFGMPVSIISKAIMGRAMGIVNTAGQIAGFVSPMVVGVLVDQFNGNFDVAFMYLIGSVVASTGCCLMLRQQKTEPRVVAAVSDS